MIEFTTKNHRYKTKLVEGEEFIYRDEKQLGKFQKPVRIETGKIAILNYFISNDLWTHYTSEEVKEVINDGEGDY